MQNKTFKRGLGLSLILVFLLSGCSNNDSANESAANAYPFSYSDTTMGTSFSIKVSQLPTGVRPKKVKIAIREKLEQINQQMSTYITDSELSRINSSTDMTSRFISEGLYKVVETAQEINHLSEGAYDITVGSLVNLWGFGPSKALSHTPKDEDIQKLLADVGSDKIVLTARLHTLSKTRPNLYMDLSSLAKGYAVDEIAAILDALKITHYMVEIGGELNIKGKNKQGKNWRIGVEAPNAKKRELLRVLPISDIAMATSGDYRNYFEQDGQRFSHTIDPRTGYPITHKLVSVTVLGDTTMKADAWATALMVLGPEKGYQIAEQQKLAVLFISKMGAGFLEQETPLFTEYTKRKGQ
ncbi:MAG: FAD:protein FMN transferase ApbE [Methyloprofundus sp.]|nr:FAD:protein FMN transferase ApbE [Methyloprofundus sp.]